MAILGNFDTKTINGNLSQHNSFDPKFLQFQRAKFLGSKFNSVLTEVFLFNPINLI